MHALIACSSKKVCAYYECTLISAIVLRNGSRSWQADEDAVSDVIISAREYGPVLHVGGEILQLTHEDRNDGCAVHFATVYGALGRERRAMVVGYVPRGLSCKCSLSSVALRVCFCTICRSVSLTRKQKSTCRHMR